MKFLHKLYRSLVLIWITVLILAFGSCKKFVEIPSSPSLIVSSQVFSDSTDADAAVLAVYITIMRNPTALQAYNGNITIFAGLSSDELYSTRNLATENSIYANSLTSSNTALPNIWANSYSTIYKANAIIEGISGSTNTNGFSGSSKNQLTGEAKLIRAWMYFNLVNLYGAVPLITTTNFEKNAQLPRTSVDSIYSQIISDLVSAEALLPLNYPTNGRARPNQATASALLARAYLYKGDWKNAEIEAGKVIGNTAVYGLSTDLNTVFLSAESNVNTEAIWQLSPVVAGYETTEGYYFVPSTNKVIPKYPISNFLLNAFETDDQRKINWLGSNIVNSKTYYYPNKYKLGRDGNSVPVESYMIFRLGEQYLIRAEARAQQNKLADAASDLDAIRLRAGLSNTTANTQTDLLTAIYHERQVELFCEWGHRWYDLKRTGLATTVMATVTPTKGGTWKDNWRLYPISLSDLRQNPFLIQNPGY